MIDVSRDHINRGNKGNNASCPIALALNSANEEWVCYVWSYMTHIYNKNELPKIQYWHSDQLREWIERYDRSTDGSKPEPITLVFRENTMDIQPETDF